MRNLLARLLVLAMPMLGAGVVTYWCDGPKAGASAFQDKTARQWEIEIQEWEILARYSGGRRLHPDTWVQCWGTPTFRERLEEWWGQVTGRFPVKCEHLGLCLIEDLPGFCFIEDLPAGLSADAEAVPVLLELLRSRNPVVRCAATQALGMIGQPAREALPALTAALLDPDHYVREVAAWALTRTGKN